MRCGIYAARKAGDRDIAGSAALARNRGGELGAADGGIAGADDTDARLRRDGEIAFDGKQRRRTSTCFNACVYSGSPMPTKRAPKRRAASNSLCASLSVAIRMERVAPPRAESSGRAASAVSADPK